MQIFLDTTAAFLDASILTIYLSSTLNKFKKEKALWYIISLILIEVLLYVNQSWVASIDSPVFTGMSTIISIVTTFIASLFFISKMHVRILAAAFFQVLYNISETVFSYLVLHFQPDIMDIDDPHLLYAVMGFGTTIFFLFLILALRLLLKKNRHQYPIQFNLLLLLVPAMTVILLSVIDSRSFYNSGNITAYILFTVMLSMINIINYVQIQWSARFLQDRHQVRVGRGLHGEIFVKALVPGERGLQFARVGANRRLVVDVERRRPAPRDLLKLLGRERNRLLHGGHYTISRPARTTSGALGELEPARLGGIQLLARLRQARRERRRARVVRSVERGIGQG